MKPAIAFVTLGCAKNEVDSAHMKQLLSEAGMTLTDRIEQADAVIVNTCSFIQSAIEESIEAILDAADLDRVREGKCALVVAGCLPARYGDDLSQELGEVSRFVPCSEEGLIVEAVQQALADRRPQTLLAEEVRLDDAIGDERKAAVATSDHAEAEASVWFDDELDAVKDTNAVSAYVKISEGCDRFCSYCAIPFIRGRYHSFPYQQIADEVDRLTASGVREICLIAQDTGRWGEDLKPASSLAALVGALADAHPDTWFRIMYLQPEGVTDDLLATVASHANICSYFDIPLQHVDAGLLKAMNRSGSREEFERLFARIFAAVPDAVLRTTLIVGFPGETVEQFDELCSFVEDAPFDYVGLFPYSAEEGTRAARLPDQCDEEEKLDRAQRLRDIADSVCTARIAKRAGSTVAVLVEGAEGDGQLFGRTMQQAPDVDGVTFLYNGAVGEIDEVCITDTLWYDMEGE